MKLMSVNKKKRARRSDTGQFTTLKYAVRHPSTTELEAIKKKKK